MAIGGAVAVGGLAQKGLDGGDLGAAHGLQLRHLHNPHALEALHGLLALKGAEAVRIPGLTHEAQERGFIAALGAGQNNHGVKLRPRLADAPHGGHKSLAGHGLYILRIIRPQILNEKALQSGPAVPLQAVQVAENGVVCVISGAGHKGRVKHTGGVKAQDLFRRNGKLGPVIVRPRPGVFVGFRGVIVPGQTDTGDDLMVERVQLNAPKDGRPLIQERADVLQRLEGLAGLVV